MQKTASIYVHYGGSYSGPAPKEFLNFDASPTLRIEKIFLLGKLFKKNKNRFPKNVYYGDITKKPLINRPLAKGVYCSHVLEHLTQKDCQKALINTYKMLQKDGIFRMVMPDLEYYVNLYVTKKITSNKFLISTGLGTQVKSRNIFSIIKSLYGNSEHLWMWDYDSISKELTKVGFRKIRRAPFRDSSDPSFLLVEEKERWENALGIECIV